MSSSSSQASSTDTFHTVLESISTTQSTKIMKNVDFLSQASPTPSPSTPQHSSSDPPQPSSPPAVLKHAYLDFYELTGMPPRGEPAQYTWTLDPDSLYGRAILKLKQLREGAEKYDRAYRTQRKREIFMRLFSQILLAVAAVLNLFDGRVIELARAVTATTSLLLAGLIPLFCPEYPMTKEPPSPRDTYFRIDLEWFIADMDDAASKWKALSEGRHGWSQEPDSCTVCSDIRRLRRDHHQILRIWMGEY